MELKFIEDLKMYLKDFDSGIIGRPSFAGWLGIVVVVRPGSAARSL